MLKIIAGGAIAALFMLAAPNAASAASADKSPAAGPTAGDHQVTEFSDQRRRYVRRYYSPRRVVWGPRFVRPYPYSYAAWGAPVWGPSWGYRPYYRPYYRPWPYRAYYRPWPGPAFAFGFGPSFAFWF